MFLIYSNISSSWSCCCTAKKNLPPFSDLASHKTKKGQVWCVVFLFPFSWLYLRLRRFQRIQRPLWLWIFLGWPSIQTLGSRSFGQDAAPLRYWTANVGNTCHGSTRMDWKTRHSSGESHHVTFGGVLVGSILDWTWWEEIWKCNAMLFFAYVKYQIISNINISK